MPSDAEPSVAGIGPDCSLRVLQGTSRRIWLSSTRLPDRGPAALASAKRKIGYTPEDDSQINFADRIAELARAAKK